MGKYQGDYMHKKYILKNNCFYGLNYFCDGKVNKSVCDSSNPKPPCPNRFNCEIRCEESLIKT